LSRIQKAILCPLHPKVAGLIGGRTAEIDPRRGAMALASACAETQKSQKATVWGDGCQKVKEPLPKALSFRANPNLFCASHKIVDVFCALHYIPVVRCE
jgi:hypothetical protein